MFAWSPSSMFGIDLNIICHLLHVNPANKPVAQNRSNFTPERVAVIEGEIHKLLVAGFIEELVNSTSGNQLLSFMDAYSGYNQILMHEDDKVKTSFIIERGTYCYKVMPFGLKNAGATYQRLVNKIFKEQIGKTMEVYVDDMLLKTPECADHIKNLATAFCLLCNYSMRYRSTPTPNQGHSQDEVLYNSKALLDVKTRYSKLEKLILALVVSARNLRPYCQDQRVIVMTNFPLRSILHNPGASQ
ncbi:unnamed protein product [Prunus armeniaca]